MGRMRTAGLVKRGEIWHIDKKIGGIRLCESTGEKELSKAELYLAMRIERARRASIYGERPKRLFREAAERYLKENQQKRSIADDELHLGQLDAFIGDLDVRMVHMGTLQDFIEFRRCQGKKTKTINLALGTVRHILNLAAFEWLDEHGLTWLERPPSARMNRIVATMYDALRIPSIFMTASPPEHFEHTTRNGKTACDIDARYQDGASRDPHDQLIVLSDL